MGVNVRLELGMLHPEHELATAIAHNERAGALASFVGLVRPNDGEGRGLCGLFLEHHPRLTLKSLEAIATDASKRFELLQVWAIHRAGAVAPNDPIVFAAASATHRRAAFEAVDYLMDRLKSEAIFWKREDYGDGSSWVEPAAGDTADLARWSCDA